MLVSASVRSRAGGARDALDQCRTRLREHPTGERSDAVGAWERAKEDLDLESFRVARGSGYVALLRRVSAWLRA